jgi:hypothetical protein
MRALIDRYYPEIFFLITVFSYLTYIFFGIGPDPIVDIGREMYVSHAMNSGKVLYKDIYYYTGPFSPYFNSLVFKFIPLTVKSWKALNLVWTFGIGAMVWFLVSQVSGRYYALLASLVYLFCFAFQKHIFGYMNNYLTPFSLEMVHGLAFSLLLFVLYHAYLKKPSVLKVRLMGGVLGVIFLTKPEYFLPSLIVPVFLGVRNLRHLVVGFFPVLFIFFLILFPHLGMLPTLKALIGGWYYIFTTNVASLPYYQWMMGLDELGINLIYIVKSLGLFILSAAVGLGAEKLFKKSPLASLGLICTYLALMVLLFTSGQASYYYPMAFPVVLPLLAIWAYKKVDLVNEKKFFIPFVLFALVLLYKILFRSVIYHCGFAFILPSFLCLFLVPKIRNKLIYKWMALGLTLLVAGYTGYLSFMSLPYHNYKIGEAHNGMTVNKSFEGHSLMIEMVKKHVPQNATLAPFPEGLLINLLLNRPYPLKGTNYMSVELTLFGEEEVLKDIQESSPDYFLLIDNYGRPAEIYKRDFFKGEYAQSIFSWIQNNYTAVEVVSGGNASYTLMKRDN